MFLINLVNYLFVHFVLLFWAFCFPSGWPCVVDVYINKQKTRQMTVQSLERALLHLCRSVSQISLLSFESFIVIISFCIKLCFHCFVLLFLIDLRVLLCSLSYLGIPCYCLCLPWGTLYPKGNYSLSVGFIDFHFLFCFLFYIYTFGM